MKKQTKSPLKSSPLRIPGQSLDEEIQKVLDEEVFSYLLLPLIMILFMILNWLLWYQIIQIPNPIITTFFVIGLSVYSYFKMLKVRKRIKALRLGRDGERAVGQTLESLRRKGYRVFHDLIGEGFNLDHVLVGEHGVFSIETKTYSKPEKGECKIIVNSTGISINGRSHEKKILIQAEAQKNWLEKQIVNLTGIKLSVKPVVAFPGWYIDNRNQGANVWVLEPKALPAFINKLPKILTEEQVRLISNHVSRFIRTTYNEKP
jgi:hypothetical protein